MRQRPAERARLFGGVTVVVAALASVAVTGCSSSGSTAAPPTRPVVTTVLPYPAPTLSLTAFDRAYLSFGCDEIATAQAAERDEATAEVSRDLAHAAETMSKIADPAAQGIASALRAASNSPGDPAALIRSTLATCQRNGETPQP